MTPLIEIRHDDDFAPGSPHIERTAARAVITQDGELLLLRSRHGDYKFPGGGVEVDESAQGAVRRELREECGLLDVSVGGLVCTTVELSHAHEPGAVFKMTSLYFGCATRDTPGVQSLDDYERDLVHLGQCGEGPESEREAPSKSSRRPRLALAVTRDPSPSVVGEHTPMTTRDTTRRVLAYVVGSRARMDRIALS